MKRIGGLRLRSAIDRSNWLRALGTLLTIALMVYLLSKQGWSEISRALMEIPPQNLALALALMFISRFAVTARWYVLLRSINTKINFMQSLRLTFAGLFASNFLPTTIGGDVFRLAGAIRLGYDSALITASLIVDRLVGMAGMALAIPFSLPEIMLWRSSPPSDTLDDRRLPLSLLAYALHQLSSHSPFHKSTFLSAHGENALNLSLASLPPGKWVQNIWQKGLGFMYKTFSALALWVRHPGSLLISLGCSGIHMLCLFLVIYLLLGSVGEHMSLWMIGGLYSLVYFVTLIPISINGYGVQEISMTFIFSNLGRAPLSTGLTVALLFRTLLMIASLPGAFFLPGILAADNPPSQENRSLE
jgi:glycosyltransferase 2 family protein